MELANAVGLLLANKVCLEKNSYHLYKNGKDKYVILHFDQKGNLIHDDEREYTISEEAVKEFVVKASLIQQQEKTT